MLHKYRKTALIDTGVEGERWAVAKDIFEKTYERVE